MDNKINEEFKPFENDQQAIVLGSEDNEFNIENGKKEITIYGQFSVKKGRAGNKKQLEEIIDVLTKIKNKI